LHIEQISLSLSYAGASCMVWLEAFKVHHLLYQGVRIFPKVVDCGCEMQQTVFELFVLRGRLRGAGMGRRVGWFCIDVSMMMMMCWRLGLMLVRFGWELGRWMGIEWAGVEAVDE
jgi:hypothetical protein